MCGTTVIRGYQMDVFILAGISSLSISNNLRWSQRLILTEGLIQGQYENIRLNLFI